MMRMATPIRSFIPSYVFLKVVRSPTIARTVKTEIMRIPHRPMQEEDLQPRVEFKTSAVKHCFDLVLLGVNTGWKINI